MSEDLPFGTWLREYRTNHDLTRRDLAQMIGCSLETIRKIESGERRPSKQVATLLAEKLDFSPEERPRFVEYARRLPPPAAPTRRDFAPIKRAVERPQSSGTPNNLRIPLTTLIGRHRELATIFAYLQ